MSENDHQATSGDITYHAVSKYLSIEEEIIGPLVIVRPDGAIYIPEAEGFDKYMRELLFQGRSSIIINFAKVKQLPSLVFATIIMTYKECQLQGGDLRLCSIPASLMRVFVTMQFDKIFTICDDESSARKSFRHLS